LSNPNPKRISGVIEMKEREKWEAGIEKENTRKKIFLNE